MAGKEDLAAAGTAMAGRAAHLLKTLLDATEEGVALVQETRPARDDVKAWEAWNRSVAGLVRTLNVILTGCAKLDRLGERRGKRDPGRETNHGHEDGMVDHRQDEWDDADIATLEAELRARIDHNNRLHEIKQRERGRLPGLAEERDPADAPGA